MSELPPKRERMMPRDGALSMSLTGGEGRPYLIPMESAGFLETYFLNKTFQVRTPDNNDPARTKPNAPSSWNESDSVGYSNPIVARVFVQCAEALKEGSLKRGNVDHVKKALHDCKEALRNCEKAFVRLATANDEIVQRITAAGGVHAEKRVVNNLPQIPDLEHDATVFLTCARRALQGVAEVLNSFYGITIQNARFDVGKTQLRAQVPPPADLLQLLDIFDFLVIRVLDLRNGQDHTPRTTIIDNFRLSADAIQSPAWRVEPNPQCPMLPEMNEIIGAIINFAEASFFRGLVDNINLHEDAPFHYAAVPVPEEQRANLGAIRYRFELRFNQ